MKKLQFSRKEWIQIFLEGALVGAIVGGALAILIGVTPH